MTHDHSHADPQNDLTEMLDLDAEVFAPALEDVYADIATAAHEPIRTIVDLGAGTGTGTFGLLRHFEGATATAVDASPEMLTHLSRQAEHLGLGDRTTTLVADLDQGIPDVGPVDLVWASASLHHLADPDRTLSQLGRLVRPGGLVAVVELDGFSRFVPDGAPGAGAEARAQALIDADRAVHLPAMGSDWGSMLTTAGLTVVQHRPIIMEIAAPVPEVARRYAAATLARVVGAVGERLDPADRNAIEALLDGGPGDVRHRADLRVSTERRLWIARL
jgi:SAM-dependent methyltransferase